MEYELEGGVMVACLETAGPVTVAHDSNSSTNEKKLLQQVILFNFGCLSTTLKG